ncbi:hypothetical protein [Serratia quinivorans]|uniref:hypothetical protein n=1 Tax=Serratia quinivorans TaxID=137545 RepID=UPI003F9878F6
MIPNRATVLGLTSMLLLVLALLPSFSKAINAALPALLHSVPDSQDESADGGNQKRLSDSSGMAQLDEPNNLSRGNVKYQQASKLRMRTIAGDDNALKNNRKELQKSDSDLPDESTSAKFNFQSILLEVKRFVRRKILSHR